MNVEKYIRDEERTDLERQLGERCTVEAEHEVGLFPEKDFDWKRSYILYAAWRYHQWRCYGHMIMGIRP